MTSIYAREGRAQAVRSSSDFARACTAICQGQILLSVSEVAGGYLLPA